MRFHSSNVYSVINKIISFSKVRLHRCEMIKFSFDNSYDCTYTFEIVLVFNMLSNEFERVHGSHDGGIQSFIIRVVTGAE